MLVGAKPRGPGMLRKDLLEVNAKLFKKQAEIIDAASNCNTKVLVVGNPCNTNALAMQKVFKNIPKENITALSRLDQNRAIGIIAQKLKVSPKCLYNINIYGNHSKTLFVDISEAFYVSSPKCVSEINEGI